MFQNLVSSLIRCTTSLVTVIDLNENLSIFRNSEFGDVSLISQLHVGFYATTFLVLSFFFLFSLVPLLPNKFLSGVSVAASVGFVGFGFWLVEICCSSGWDLVGRSRVRMIWLFSRFLIVNLVTSLCHLKVQWLVAVPTCVLGLSSVGGSFGSNLNTSSLPSEIYFSVLISISGMMLFLVYLNARVQESQESFKELNAKKKKQLMIPDVDLWLSKNDLPKDLKTVIMDNIHKLENNTVINVQSILSVLPIHDKNQIVYRLCMSSLRKVPLLETMNENVLKGIAEHLKPVIYNEDNYIAQEGKPLGKMLFITQGIAWTYTANGSVGTICDSKWLERGSFCGEELLNGAFKSPFLPDIPISTRTVISQEQVEAFAIRASDLKSVVVKFWWYFSMKLTNVSQLEQWEHLAACSIQATWRHHRCAKAKGLKTNSGLMCCGKHCF